MLSNRMISTSLEGDQSAKFNPDSLDNLYFNQLQSLRTLTLKLNNAFDIDLCRKWLQVFNKTSEDEKISRNCLCTLMCQQLQTEGYLSEPFTDLNNFNRHLDHVLNELDNNSTISLAMYLDTMRTYSSHKKTMSILDECKENEIQAENVKLRRELEAARMTLTEQDMKITELMEMVRNCNSFRGDKKKEKAVNAEEITTSISQALDELKRNPIFEFEIFSRIFSKCNKNEEMQKKLKDCDNELKTILQRIFDLEISKIKKELRREAYTKLKKKKAKLLLKYERTVRENSLMQEVKLKLIKLKCFALMQKLFARVRREPDINMMNFLNELEEKYKQILEDILTHKKI